MSNPNYAYIQVAGGLANKPPDAAMLREEADFWSRELAHTSMDSSWVEFISVAVTPERVVVAGVAAHLIESQQSTLFVDSLFTLDGHRNSGLATGLLRHLLLQEFAASVAELRLIPTVGSVDYYRRRGFVPSGTDPLGPHVVAVDTFKQLTDDRSVDYTLLRH